MVYSKKYNQLIIRRIVPATHKGAVPSDQRELIQKNHVTLNLFKVTLNLFILKTIIFTTRKNLRVRSLSSAPYSSHFTRAIAPTVRILGASGALTI